MLGYWRANFLLLVKLSTKSRIRLIYSQLQVYQLIVSKENTKEETRTKNYNGLIAEGIRIAILSLHIIFFFLIRFQIALDLERSKSIQNIGTVTRFSRPFVSNESLRSRLLSRNSAAMFERNNGCGFLMPFPNQENYCCVGSFSDRRYSVLSACKCAGLNLVHTSAISLVRSGKCGGLHSLYTQYSLLFEIDTYFPANTVYVRLYSGASVGVQSRGQSLKPKANMRRGSWITEAI